MGARRWGKGERGCHALSGGYVRQGAQRGKEKFLERGETNEDTREYEMGYIYICIYFSPTGRSVVVRARALALLGLVQ